MHGILITRPTEDSLLFARKIKGYKRYIQPLLNVVPVNVEKTYGAQALIFTSKHAAELWAKQSSDRSLKAYCVGEITAEVCRRAGFKKVKTADGNARALLEMIASEPSQSYLFPSGEDVTVDFEEMLGCDVCRRVIVYKAVPTLQLRASVIKAFERGEIRYVTLFSKKSAMTLKKLLEMDLDGYRDFEILTLSEAIANMFPGHPFRIFPDQEGMVEFFEKVD